MNGHRLATACARSRRKGHERGFTIAELLVTVTLFTVGVLAILGTGTFVTRMMGESTRQTLATSVAQSRIDQLRSNNWSCANYQTDSTTTRGIKEVWTISVMSPRAVSASVSVTYATQRYAGAQGYQRTQRYQSVILCG